MNKNILETLIMNSFNIETRKDFREENKGNLVPLNLSLSCDLACIRMYFKRMLVKENFKTIVLRDNRLNNTRITTGSFINGWNLNTIEGRDKVLKSIENWCNKVIKEGLFPEKIILE